MWFGRILLGVCCGAAWIGAARADTYAGAAWAVHFNRPDQTTSAASIGSDEFVLRDALLARIDALASGDWACLATYTFSGNTAAGGAAGPILAAMSNALARGARLAFVADNGVDVTSNYWPGVSLAGLAARPDHALELSRGGRPLRRMGRTCLPRARPGCWPVRGISRAERVRSSGTS